MGFCSKILPLMDKNSKKKKRNNLLAGNVVQINANVTLMLMTSVRGLK